MSDEDGGKISITEVVASLSAVAAIAGPLYLFGLLFTVRQIQRVYNVDYATSWTAGGFLSKTFVIVNGANALKNPVSLISPVIVLIAVVLMAALMFFHMSPLIVSRFAHFLGGFRL